MTGGLFLFARNGGKNGTQKMDGWKAKIKIKTCFSFSSFIYDNISLTNFFHNKKREYNRDDKMEAEEYGVEERNMTQNGRLKRRKVRKLKRKTKQYEEQSSLIGLFHSALSFL